MSIRTTSLLLALVAGLMIAGALTGCETEPDGADEAGGSELAGIVLEDDAMSAQLDSASGIALKEGAIHQEQAQFLELAAAFEERTGRKLDGVQLSAGQADLLQTMLSDEEDISLRGLLQQIIDTRTHINELEDEIDLVKSELPTPTMVERGDTHLGLAADYLMKNHGLTKKEADELAARSLLTNNLAPGMEVWHFYADGVYGTTVTQGTARVSPFFLNVRETRTLRSERDEALALAASLEAEITVLEATRDQLRDDLQATIEQRDDLQYERDILEDDKEQLVEADESAYFYVDTTRRLREKDILAPAGMRLKDWRKDLFTQRLDLRTQTSLRVYAEDFGVRRLRRVILLPKDRFKEGVDYAVSYDDDGAIATIELKTPERFKNDAFVVVLK
jgi:hypothetical protein